jgi:hypothetical protein
MPARPRIASFSTGWRKPRSFPCDVERFPCSIGRSRNNSELTQGRTAGNLKPAWLCDLPSGDQARGRPEKGSAIHDRPKTTRRDDRYRFVNEAGFDQFFTEVVADVTGVRVTVRAHETRPPSGRGRSAPSFRSVRSPSVLGFFTRSRTRCSTPSQRLTVEYFFYFPNREVSQGSQVTWPKTVRYIGSADQSRSRRR